MATAILFSVFALLLVLGIPVAFALIAASLATVLYLGLPAIVVVQQVAAGISGTSLIAIPLFIFAGELMMRGGISERLISFAASLVGHIRGGLGQVNVLASLLFGGVSGSAIADGDAATGYLDHCETSRLRGRAVPRFWSGTAAIRVGAAWPAAGRADLHRHSCGHFHCSGERLDRRRLRGADNRPGLSQAQVGNFCSDLSRRGAHDRTDPVRDRC